MNVDPREAGPANGSGDDDHLAAALRQAVPAMLKAIAGSAVEEIRLERGGIRLSLRRIVVESLAGAGLAGDASPALAAPPALELETQPAILDVSSAHVGIFHRAREPGGPILAEEGAVVEGGKAIGVVETRGMSADVEAPATGRLIELRVQDGQPVEYGQSLAIIQPD